jgi:molecular chaperone HtpG
MSPLTKAENEADKARELPNFKNLSLPGIRSEVEKMLGLIGRVDGIFSTYTSHDISHIDPMLKMLNWLIPKSTAEVMTSTDWLMIVLSIYFHDLGMLVTSEEYEKRYENKNFKDWLDGLDKASDGQEYLSRTNRMTDVEKERFFFQEFIRLGHAVRIREWITGKHSQIWGTEVKPISEIISKLLDVLPSRFREDLGKVCESHHNDNLDNTDLYQLCARYGSEQQEIVSVQYAAILLRTTDLLHITKDRTPSIAYKVLRLSDPKAVSEWDKQLGTFSVAPKGRELVERDKESAIIMFHADFTQERPFFALQEYIAYANSQIQQSKRWAEKSQESADAKEYGFPWHSVKGDVRLEGVPPQPLSFELDRGRLLDLLVGHTIYNEPTVAVRELLQNSIDAIRYQHYLNGREARAKGLPEPKIRKSYRALESGYAESCCRR